MKRYKILVGVVGVVMVIGVLLAVSMVVVSIGLTRCG